MARRRPRKKTEANVLISCLRKCCLCWFWKEDDSQKNGQIAHIDRDPSNASEGNLVYLCQEHHDAYDTEHRQTRNITPIEVRKAREDLLRHLKGSCAESVSLTWRLGHDFNGFTNEHVREFVEFLKKHCRPGCTIEVVARSPGNVLLTTKVAPEDAIRLMAAWDAGRLHEADVLDVMVTDVSEQIAPDRERSQMEKPTVFVGSSSEGLDIARAIQYQLKDDAHVSIWNEGVFGLSQGTLESLVCNLDRFDFAVLVFTPDDLVVSRDVESQAPRDNIMFELGLFMGRLGPSRTFGVCARAEDIKLPSDLAGVSLARYDVAHAHKDLTSAIGAACYEIRQAIRDLGVCSRIPAAGHESPEEKLAETYFKIEADVSGLASEMHREHAASLTAWRQSAGAYIRLCQKYQKSAVDELIASITVQRHLRASVEQVRDVVTNGFAETISILGEKPSGREGFKERFDQAAKRVWRMADEVRDYADQLVTED